MLPQPPGWRLRKPVSNTNVFKSNVLIVETERRFRFVEGIIACKIVVELIVFASQSVARASSGATSLNPRPLRRGGFNPALDMHWPYMQVWLTTQRDRHGDGRHLASNQNQAYCPCHFSERGSLFAFWFDQLEHRRQAFSLCDPSSWPTTLDKAMLPLNLPLHAYQMAQCYFNSKILLSSSSPCSRAGIHADPVRRTFCGARIEIWRLKLSPSWLHRDPGWASSLGGGWCS
jgi:hypothetical protein